jgi:hypothetical protein
MELNTGTSSNEITLQDFAQPWVLGRHLEQKVTGLRVQIIEVNGAGFWVRRRPSGRSRRRRRIGLHGVCRSGRGVGAMSRRGGLEALVVLLAGGLFFLWAILGCSTPQDQARLADSTGRSTGVVWARPSGEAIAPIPLPSAPPSPQPPRPAPLKPWPSSQALMSGRACVELRLPLQNRPVPETNEWGYGHSIACAEG